MQLLEQGPSCGSLYREASKGRCGCRQPPASPLPPRPGLHARHQPTACPCGPLLLRAGQVLCQVLLRLTQGFQNFLWGVRGTRKHKTEGM